MTWRGEKADLDKLMALNFKILCGHAKKVMKRVFLKTNTLYLYSLIFGICTTKSRFHARNL